MCSRCVFFGFCCIKHGSYYTSHLAKLLISLRGNMTHKVCGDSYKREPQSCYWKEPHIRHCSPVPSVVMSLCDVMSCHVVSTKKSSSAVAKCNATQHKSNDFNMKPHIDIHFFEITRKGPQTML